MQEHPTPLYLTGDTAMNIYLLLKTHNQTGLKYLCMHKAKSIDACIRYRGSGKMWKKHISEYGYDVTTEILYKTENMQDFRQKAEHISEEYNIVNDETFANLKNETGTGGWVEIWNKGKTKESDARLKMLIEKSAKTRTGKLYPSQIDSIQKARQSYWTKYPNGNKGKKSSQQRIEKTSIWLRNSKWMYDPITLKRIKVQKEEVNDYIIKGYVLGYKRSYKG